MFEIWFWQRIISPHMVGLAKALSKQGFVVHYMIENTMSAERSKLGWQRPDTTGLQIHEMQNAENIAKVVSQITENSYHICQGLRANGLVERAEHLLAKWRLKQWILMETVDDTGWRGYVKRLEYRKQFLLKRQTIKGVLAIGHATGDWMIARGMPSTKVFPFAYFLTEPEDNLFKDAITNVRFKFIFVGQFIERKRLGLLVDALQSLDYQGFELIVIGSGPLENELRVKAEIALPGRVSWLGKLPSSAVSAVIAEADCLVLPSRYDGWGAVVSEALMVGTPVICSSTCGSSEVVELSGHGGVFHYDKPEELKSLLEHQLEGGPVSSATRHKLANWSQALGADAGARYLIDIFNFSDNACFRPVAPWKRTGKE